MGKHPLQSVFFAVNCTYQKDDMPFGTGARLEKKADLMRFSEEHGMMERLLGTLHRLCAGGHKGHRAAAWENALHKGQIKGAVV